MVGIRERVFFISGDNFFQRQLLLQNIKERILPNESVSLNVLTFHSKEIDIKDLQEKVFTVSFGKNKILIFKDFHNLSVDLADFLFNNLKKILATSYIIFETDKNYYQLVKNKKFTSNNLFSLLLKRAALFKLAPIQREFSIENIINSIRKNDLVSSLYILEKLIRAGAKEKMLGPQIIGILVGKFSYLSDPVEKERVFNHLWEADRAIKEKGLDARTIIETLLVKVFRS